MIHSIKSYIPLLFQSGLRHALPWLLLIQSYSHQECQGIRSLDDVLGGLLMLHNCRDIQRRVDLLASILLRSQAFAGVLAA